MEGLRDYGNYIYFGIQNQLKMRIKSKIFKKSTIEVSVSIDGLPLYRNSLQQCWPILMKVHCDEYICQPFVVGLFCGNSKPLNTEDFLHDFVEEAAQLTRDGFINQGTTYNFKIKAFICDTPARAFIKCIKSHNGFYACERCIIRGVSVSSRRVYPNMDCALRTHDTFIEKADENHHILNKVSPLLAIPHFDIVRAVLLDNMHLLYCGVSKCLLFKWKSGNPLSRISVAKRYVLTEHLIALKNYIPMEFQRKVFDYENLSNWKATQFRFFLLYCGPLILKDVLSDDKYKHFLLLHTACRIMKDRKSVV